MCGRYVVFSDQDYEEMKNIITEINDKFGEGAMPSGDIFPTGKAPVFVAREGEIGATLMTWGLPQYKGSGVIINARAETAPEKQTFRAALQMRRCVIPSTGFYEWNKVDGQKKKDKYLFQLPNSPMLYMAGLYNPYANELPRYVILTTEANDSMKEIHNRMPVVLLERELANWINDPRITMDILNRTPPELVGQRVE